MKLRFSVRVIVALSWFAHSSVCRGKKRQRDPPMADKPEAHTCGGLVVAALPNRDLFSHRHIRARLLF